MVALTTNKLVVPAVIVDDCMSVSIAVTWPYNWAPTPGAYIQKLARRLVAAPPPRVRRRLALPAESAGTYVISAYRYHLPPTTAHDRRTLFAPATPGVVARI